MMMPARLTVREIPFWLLTLVVLAACGGDGSSNGGGPPPTPHTIGGTISGLTGSGLVLQDNGGDSLKISGNGNFTFATSVLGGNPFNVTVSTQPTNPAQTCAVAHGSGTVSGNDITNVAVTCTTESFTVGGTVSGLAGSGLVLADNGANDTPVAKNGPFSFSTALASGSAYNITVATQPASPPQTCAVGNASGTVTAGNISTVSVTCATNTYSVGGHVSGLAGSGLALSYNGGAAISVSRNGGFTAAAGIAIGTAYSVAIVAQPANPAQTCVLSNGSGAVGTANVASILVSCPQAVGRFAYVVGAGTETPSSPPMLGTISVFTINPVSGALTLIPASAVSTGPIVSSFQFVPHTSFAWALNEGFEYPLENGFGLASIYDYSVDATTGLLTPVSGSPFSQLDGTSTTPGCASPPNAPAPTGFGTTAYVTFAPSGTFGFVTNVAADTGGNMGMNANAQTWRFTVDPTNGAPSLVPGSSIPQVCGGSDVPPVTIDPSGQFAYIPGNETFAFEINAQTDALIQAPGSPYSLAGGGDSVVIDPAGRFAYVLGNGISGFSIDPSTGALTPIVGSPFAIPYAFAMAIDPKGQFAYVVKFGAAGGGVYIYAIGPTGALTAVSAGASVALSDPSSFTIDPSGEFAYAVGRTGTAVQTGVYAYTIDAVTGALTPVAGNPVATSSNPVEVTVTN
jgi:hypothetical protein